MRLSHFLSTLPMASLFFLRQRLLDLLNREKGASLTSAEVHTRLAKPKPSLKTVKRALESLSGPGGPVVKENAGQGKRTGWKIGKHSLSLALQPTEAMTLYAIFEHADRFGMQLHTQDLDELRDYVVQVMKGHSLARPDLRDRVTSATRFQLLQPGRYDPNHLTRIQVAIRDAQPLRVVYRTREPGEILCVYHLKPLALAYQDSNIYLSAYVKEEQWPEGYEPGERRAKYCSNGPNSLCGLMLHRIVEVSSSPWVIEDPDGYDLHSLEVQKHLVSIYSGEPVQLRLRLSPNLHNRLSENPLCKEQQLSLMDDGRWELTCSMHDTQGLRLFLMSNVADIEVCEPASLRTYVKNSLAKAVALYAD